MAARLWHEASAVRAAANIALDDAHVAVTIRASPRCAGGCAISPTTASPRGVPRRRRPTFSPSSSKRRRGDAARAHALTTTDAAATVVRVVLSIAGLSWTEQRDLLAAHPDLIRADWATSGRRFECAACIERTTCSAGKRRTRDKRRAHGG
jgi:hypothetical protein